jgi:hypothetical protein
VAQLVARALVLEDAAEQAFLRHAHPEHLISARESVFRGELLAQLLTDWSVKRCFGAVRRHGSIAVTERLIWTLKREWLAPVALIRGLGNLGRLVADFQEYCNECRCHQRLGARRCRQPTGGAWRKPERSTEQVTGSIRMRHSREQRITVCELAA